MLEEANFKSRSGRCRKCGKFGNYLSQPDELCFKCKW